MLYVREFTLRRAFSSSSWQIATSVVMKPSIVAMFGAIIPLPLEIPPTWHFLPSISNSTAISFLRVSVVIIASHASLLCLEESSFARVGMRAFIGFMESG